MNKLNKKIEQIENLLNCNTELEKYIKDIESSNIDIPNNLENILLEKFSNIETPPKIKKINTIKENTVKILKIAACTMFALIMWNYITLSPIKIEHTQNHTIQTPQTENETYFKDKLQLAGNFLLTPINFERNDR